MSSFSNGQLVNARREISHDPTASTHDTPGSARPRTTRLDVMACLRRFLQHVLPDGFMKVRHCGLLPARCAIPPDTLRLMIVQAHPMACQPTQRVSPQPLAARCPTCGAPMRVVMRLWTSERACVDTGCAGSLGHDERGAVPCATTSAPVRPQHDIRQPGGAETKIHKTHGDAKTLPLSPDDAHTMILLLV
jgi:hypothetical protein